MAGRSIVVWFAIMFLAIANGAARDVLLRPILGDQIARALSCLTLAALIYLVAWLTLDWIAPANRDDAWRIGLTWLILTLTFEFGAGHYLFGTSWRALLADYNIMAGRLWILVLLASVTAPAVAFRGSVPWSPPSSPSVQGGAHVSMD